MSDFIYPKCPDCGEKASEGEGASLGDVSSQTFWWTCSECKKRHNGTFGLLSKSVTWIETRKPKLRYRILIKINKKLSNPTINIPEVQ